MVLAMLNDDAHNKRFGHKKNIMKFHPVLIDMRVLLSVTLISLINKLGDLSINFQSIRVSWQVLDEYLKYNQRSFLCALRIYSSIIPVVIFLTPMTIFRNDYRSSILEHHSNSFGNQAHWRN